VEHRIPKPALALSIVAAALALLTFIFLNQAFEGPSVISAVQGKPYELKATFKDTEVLPTKQAVLSRGVEIGKVTAVNFNQEESTATVLFTVDGDYTPVHRDAAARIGERTLLGDPYINLELGHEAAGDLESGSEVRALPSVDFDEAFTFLDETGRGHVKSTLETLDRATRTPGGGTRLNATTSELSRTLHELRQLTDTLRGQEEDLAGLVGDSSIVLRELGDREAALTEVVSSGRLALDALAARTDSLEQGIAELPRLLDSGRRVLAEARPLIREATPLVRRLREVAPDLVPAIRQLGPLSDQLADLIPGISQTVNALRPASKLIGALRRVVGRIVPAVRNTTALVQYTSPRARSLGALDANLAGVSKNGDSESRWVRFAIILEQGEIDDNPTPANCSAATDDVAPNAGFCHNAYPAPNDPIDNEPYVPGSYPRVKAFKPPPAKKRVERGWSSSARAWAAG
jgi:phospholipid/cholesterol/gamma-HCH transport system substrate-binding protein